jgi:ZIP family zinc transporter
METGFWTVLIIAAVAAAASLIGGLIAFWRKPTPLAMSLALGYAGGVLLGTIGLEMIPQALESTSVVAVIGGFALGLALVYAFDLFVHRGMLAGRKAAQRGAVEQFHSRHRPRGDKVTVLAGGTSAEELIEGLSIGVGAAIRPSLGLLIALAIVIDNVAEGLSIGLLVRDDQNPKQNSLRRAVLWTGLIGASLLGSTLIGWLLLRGMPAPILGFLFAAGGGGMFYLTVTTLVPEAEERQYQQSGALAMGAGFVTILALGALSRG